MQERIHWEHVGILRRSWLRNAMRSGAGISYLIVFLLVILGIVRGEAGDDDLVARLLEAHQKLPATPHVVHALVATRVT